MPACFQRKTDPSQSQRRLNKESRVRRFTVAGLHRPARRSDQLSPEQPTTHKPTTHRDESAFDRIAARRRLTQTRLFVDGLAEFPFKKPLADLSGEELADLAAYLEGLAASRNRAK